MRRLRAEENASFAPGRRGARANKFTQFAQAQTAIAGGNRAPARSWLTVIEPRWLLRKRGPRRQDTAMERREASGSASLTRPRFAKRGTDGWRLAALHRPHSCSEGKGNTGEPGARQRMRAAEHCLRATARRVKAGLFDNRMNKKRERATRLRSSRGSGDRRIRVSACVGISCAVVRRCSRSMPDITPSSAPPPGRR